MLEDQWLLAVAGSCIEDRAGRAGRFGRGLDTAFVVGTWRVEDRLAYQEPRGSR